jgi:hypothetical protein
MQCPLCGREEVEESRGLFTCDCPQHGYRAPLGRVNPGYVAFINAFREPDPWWRRLGRWLRGEHKR